ncbi:MAG: glycosyltransferase family 39 protein [Candidatus Binataceae bacterium]
MAQSGFRRAAELMPWPDGLEYAASAVNLYQGRGAVLHFGGYSYPSRYTEGYPLILAAAFPIVGHRVAELGAVSVAMGMLALVALYILVFRMFGRTSAAVAGSIMAVSPVFVTYSTLVLSDIATLAVTILAALALKRATDAEEAREHAPERSAALAYWALFGVFAGFTVMIRPTNATMLAGVALSLAVVRPPTLRQAMAGGIAFAVGFIPFPAWQAHENAAHLGGAFASGYVFWVPEVYGVFSRTFNLSFLAGPTMPRNPSGNISVYLGAIAGLDGFTGFHLYPFGAAAFAAIGLGRALRSPVNRATTRVILFGLGFLAALTALYLFYFFTDVVFILPTCFVLFAAAGYGATLANRSLAARWRKSRRSTRDYAIIAGAIALDLIVALSILGELNARLSAAPRESRMIPALLALERRIPADATVISNISLQFLELYVPGTNRSFIGLHSFDPGGDFTDYHLARLYAKRARGWSGPIPPALFDGSGIVSARAESLAAQARSGKPIYLMIWEPDSAEYADTLKYEIDQLGERFALEPVERAAPLQLYRLAPR